MTLQNIKSQNLLDPQNIKEEDLKYLGGKAGQLFKLSKLGFNVPKWTVLPHTTLHALEGSGLRLKLNQIVAELKKEFGDQVKFAVRSSANQEDGSQHSFAGQFATELNVAMDDVPKAVIKVMNSIDSKHIKSYCKENNIKNKIKMSVIIQEMIDPEVSGVAFGINPINGSREENIISAVFGLGEALVSGEVNADNYIISDKIEKQIVRKDKARRISANGTILEAIPDHLQFNTTLNEEQISTVVNTLDKLKTEFGKAQDIEFGFIGDEFFLFQSRPVTGLDKIIDQKGEMILWDNSNIVESYPGISSPLTFSFILKVYAGAYRQISRLFGVSQKVIDNNDSIYENLLGTLKGRVYYNLKNWYRMLAQLPGFKLNAGFMENMMGVKESFDLEEEDTQMGKLEAFFRVIISIVKMLWQLIRLPNSRNDFHKLMDNTISSYSKVDFQNCRPAALMNHYKKFENILLKQWKAPLVNDLYAMIFFGILQKLSKKHFPNNPDLGNRLVADSGDIISTQPATRLLKISSLIQDNPEATFLFQNQTKKEIWNQLGQYPIIQKEIQEYIDYFGDRCSGELKLETITYTQDPLKLIHIIKNYVKQGIQVKERTEENKLEAKNILKQEMKGKFFNSLLYNFVLNKSREMISGRENLRFERTRGFAMVRKIFIAIGKNWYAEGIIEEERDIFYLTQQEIFDFIKGTSINGSLKSLIALRKRTYTEFETEEDPVERIKTFGTVYHANDFYLKTTSQIEDGDLSGIACCPGVVKGKVQVIKDPTEIDSLSGDILVTTSTDPGWVTLFPTASAILVERGSLLSHSAIVAREMSIPCIVGISGLLKQLKTGDIIEMDGSTGEVKMLN